MVNSSTHICDIQYYHFSSCELCHITFPYLYICWSKLCCVCNSWLKDCLCFQDVLLFKNTTNNFGNGKVMSIITICFLTYPLKLYASPCRASSPGAPWCSCWGRCWGWVSGRICSGVWRWTKFLCLIFKIAIHGGWIWINLATNNTKL